MCNDGINMYYCECSLGYTGRDCDQSEFIDILSGALIHISCSFFAACPHPADVVFALDASGSIEQENFYIIQDFVRDIIYGINVDGGSRVGILTYASEAEVR